MEDEKENIYSQRLTQNEVNLPPKHQENGPKNELNSLISKIKFSSRRDLITQLLIELLDEQTQLDLEKLKDLLETAQLVKNKKELSKSKETEFSNDFESIPSHLENQLSGKKSSLPENSPENKNFSTMISKKLVALKEKKNLVDDRSKSVRFSHVGREKALNSKSCLVTKKSNRVERFVSNSSKIKKLSKSNVLGKKLNQFQQKKNEKKVENKSLESSNQNDKSGKSLRTRSENKAKGQAKPNTLENELQLIMNDIQDAEQNIQKMDKTKKNLSIPKRKAQDSGSENSNNVLPDGVREKSRKKIKQILNKKKGNSQTKQKHITNLTDLIKALTYQEHTKRESLEANSKNNDTNAFQLLANTTDLCSKQQQFNMSQAEHSRVIRESFKLSVLDSQMIGKSREIRTSIKPLKPQLDVEVEGIKSKVISPILETPDPSMLKTHKEEMPGFQELKLGKSKMTEERQPVNEKDLKSLRSLETLGSMYQSLNSGHRRIDGFGGLASNYVDSHLIVKKFDRPIPAPPQKPNAVNKRPNTPRYKQNPEKHPPYKTLIHQKKLSRAEREGAEGKKACKKGKGSELIGSVFDSHKNLKSKENGGSKYLSAKAKNSNRFITKSQEKNNHIAMASNKEKGLFRNFRKYMRNSSNRKVSGSVKIDFKKN